MRAAVKVRRALLKVMRQAKNVTNFEGAAMQTENGESGRAPKRAT